MDNKTIVQKVKDLLGSAEFKAACRADFGFALTKVCERSHEESEIIRDLFDAVAKYLDDLDGNAVVYLIDNIDELNDIDDGEILYKTLVDAFGKSVGEYVADAGWDCDVAERAQPFTLDDAERQLSQWRAEDEYLRRAYWRDAV